MAAATGPARYFFLRTTRGREDVENWPPAIKPLEGPANKVCDAVRLYPDNNNWRAEADDTQTATSTEPHLLLTRRTVLGLLQEGRRSRAEVGLLGVRVAAAGKDVEYATHLIVVALPGSGLGQRRPVVAPIERMVVTEYVEQGDYAEAALDLRLTNGEYGDLPPYLPDPVIQRNAQYTLSHEVPATNAYSYSDRKGQDITLEVEAGRVSLYGRVAITTEGQQAIAALQATPGVVEVADHLLYLENLKEQVEQALAAKGLENIYVLSEHGLVNLRGEAPDSKTRYQAEDIAKRIPGVRGVVNDIVVTSNVAG